MSRKTYQWEHFIKGIGTAPTDPDEECFKATFVDSLRAVDHIVKSESPVFYSKIF